MPSTQYSLRQFQRIVPAASFQQQPIGRPTSPPPIKQQVPPPTKPQQTRKQQSTQNVNEIDKVIFFLSCLVCLIVGGIALNGVLKIKKILKKKQNKVLDDIHLLYMIYLSFSIFFLVASGVCFVRYTHENQLVIVLALSFIVIIYYAILAIIYKVYYFHDELKSVIIALEMENEKKLAKDLNEIIFFLRGLYLIPVGLCIAFIVVLFIAGFAAMMTRS